MSDRSSFIMDTPSPLQQAADVVGNLNKLAKKIGKRQSTVWHWLKSGRVPADWCRPIEEATDGKVPRHVLRPDVFEPESIEPAIAARLQLMQAERAADDGVSDDGPEIAAYHAAQDRFIEARVTSLVGVRLKLERIEEVEQLDAHLAETPNLLWPRMIQALLRDLRTMTDETDRSAA